MSETLYMRISTQNIASERASEREREKEGEREKGEGRGGGVLARKGELEPSIVAASSAPH